jgi:DNA helicase II / ATP-dependent DNA helicase PcrA
MNKLTPLQKEAVYKRNGRFVVRACPGSGKTFVVAARFANLLDSWSKSHQGIAVISFTNIAHEEIERYLIDDFKVKTPIPYPHFIGTIDSFLNTFVFLPFGHKILGCGKRPTLTGPPHDNIEPIGTWLFWKTYECNKYQCKLNQFSYDYDGHIINNSPMSHFNRCQLRHSICQKKKRQFNGIGFATQNDADYFALKLVSDFPRIAKAIINRFPTFLIDEAQDSSEIQMKFLDNLLLHGLEEVMLVGDSDQAIYEWRRAAPNLFEDKYEKWKDNSLILNENWRSSQKICDFVNGITTLKKKMVAVNKDVMNFEIKPEIWGYNDNTELLSLVSKFKVMCLKYKIDKGIYVLTRGGAMQDLLFFEKKPLEKSPWHDNDTFTQKLCRARFLFDQQYFSESLKLIERAICIKLCGQYSREILIDTINKYGLVKWRSGLFSLISKLPKTNIPLGQWVAQANEILSTQSRIKPINISIKRNSKEFRYDMLTFAEIFNIKQETYIDSICHLSTVHSVKGKSIDAVMLVLKEQTTKGQGYKNILLDHLSTNEELRIVYVALTRAKKILVLVVPEKHISLWRNKLA